MSGPEGMNTIELRNVTRWYGNVVAVNDITMTIGPGVTGLLGPNGAGKSTVLHLIAGFLAPSRGELTVGGVAAWRNPEIYRTPQILQHYLDGIQFALGDLAADATPSASLSSQPRAALAPVSPAVVIDSTVPVE